MNLIVVYGAPSVGKLTVAKELAKRTKYVLFHNHLTFDPFRTILDIKHPHFWSYVNGFRRQLFRIAAKERVRGMITTMVYFKDNQIAHNYIRSMMRIAKQSKGKVYFVRLHCHDRELFRRVKHPSRKQYHKIHTKARLKQLMREQELRSAIPFVTSYTVDNTHIGPKKCARMIAQHYKLK